MFLEILTNLTVDLIKSKVKTTETYLNLKKKWLNTLVSDFEAKLGGLYLKETGRAVFVEKLEERLATTIKHWRLKNEVSYRRLIRMELYKLEKHLMNEEEYQPFVSEW